MNNLRNMRKLNSKTQDKIAQILGISQSNYAKYENEKLDIPNDILKALAHYFNVTTDYLLGVETNEKTVEDKTTTEKNQLYYDLLKAELTPERYNK